MKISIKCAMLGLALASILLPMQSALSQNAEIVSLRGAVEINENNTAAMIPQQDTKGRFERAYRQQPPLIPHKVQGYDINLKINQCMGCHDWPNSVEYGAPKISETHYIDRNGVALDYVARTRWNCNQCHVTQANAKELVDNEFKSALEVE